MRFYQGKGIPAAGMAEPWGNHQEVQSSVQVLNLTYLKIRASLIAQLVKNLPAMQETWVLSLGWDDPLEKGKATHSSILAWRIPWTV